MKIPETAAAPAAENGAAHTRPAGQLMWRCRRGTKELDVLLQRYLQQRYPQADAGERRAFEDLLELQDPELQDYLSGHAQPPELATRTLISSILATEV